jgi:hypothetical protein
MDFSNNKQKYLLGFFVIILVVTIFVWRGKFSTPAENPEESSSFNKKPIVIEFEILKNPILKDLKIFSTIPSFQGKAGQEDPFHSQ